MAVDTSVPRTRRALIAGGLGGLAVVVANALGRPIPAWAADDGNPILIGGTYPDAQVQTTLANMANNNTVLYVASNSDLGHGAGTAVEVFSASSYALRAVSTAAPAIYASSSSSDAIIASSLSASCFAANAYGPNAPAILARSNGDSTGLHGVSGASLNPYRAKTGVYGEAEQDANSRGVWGWSPAGQGVRGESTSGRGVNGQATSGLGVRGFATSGVGLSGEAATGYALRTTGRVRLDNSAGRATIASGTASVTVTPGVDLTSTSAVVATLNGDAGGSTAVKRVAIDTAANTFTIYLTANATALTKVAWIVLG